MSDVATKRSRWTECSMSFKTDSVVQLAEERARIGRLRAEAATYREWSAHIWKILHPFSSRNPHAHHWKAKRGKR